MEIQTKPLMTLRLRVGPPQIVGKTPIGDRRIVPVLDGSFQGEHLCGKVEPGGSDGSWRDRTAPSSSTCG